MPEFIDVYLVSGARLRLPRNTDLLDLVGALATPNSVIDLANVETEHSASAARVVIPVAAISYIELGQLS